MRKHIKAAALLLVALSMPVGAVMASETLPSSTAAHYEKTDMYGVWYINLKNSKETMASTRVTSKAVNVCWMRLRASNKG